MVVAAVGRKAKVANEVGGDGLQLWRVRAAMNRTLTSQAFPLEHFPGHVKMTRVSFSLNDLEG